MLTAASSYARSAERRLEEAQGLARAVDLEIAGAHLQNLASPRAATLFGSGKVEELKALIAETCATLVLVDAALSPVQQRNLERAWDVKVIDRTGLILEIFAARARTHEGRLQVELARLRYERSRLVKTWTHLERQRGGLGKTGGPGETQIESDRRLIRERIARLESKLDDVRKARTLQRSGRKKVPIQTVALVGYTNAGKSTLFNALTRAGVFAENLLFATLDPTMRGLELPSGRKIILSDTVGFISDLPTDLVAAFRATLEEVQEADVIVHVRDASSPTHEAEQVDVVTVLGELGIAPDDGRILEVFSKIDLLSEDERTLLQARARAGTAPLPISSTNGLGLDVLCAELDQRLSVARVRISAKLSASNGAAQAWLHANGEVLSCSMSEDGTVHIEAWLDPEDLGRFESRYGSEVSVERAAHLIPRAAE